MAMVGVLREANPRITVHYDCSVLDDYLVKPKVKEQGKEKNSMQITPVTFYIKVSSGGVSTLTKIINSIKESHPDTIINVEVTV